MVWQCVFQLQTFLLVDLVAELDKDVTVEEINAALKEAAEGELKGILITVKNHLFLVIIMEIHILLQLMLFQQWLLKAIWLKLFLGMIMKQVILTV